jgi:hypothetical protein
VTQKRGRDVVVAPSLESIEVIEAYAFFFDAFMLLSFFALSALSESALCAESGIIFMPVSVAAAAGAGAGAIAGVVVSGLFSDFAQAETASTAATRAKRFMTFS